MKPTGYLLLWWLIVVGCGIAGVVVIALTTPSPI